MAHIEITEVGPPEYPLITVLRDTIFAEHNHVYRTSFEDMIRDRQDVICLMAHLEGNPVGYKVGYRDRPGTFYSYSGGVLKDYRGEGVARRLQHCQHGMIRARGYTCVYFNSFNKFRNMMLFGLASGFVPINIEHRPEGEISIKFTRELTQPDPPPREKGTPLEVHVEAVGPNYHRLIADLATQTIEASSEQDIDRVMTNRTPLALVAFVDNKPVGFKLGYGRDARAHLFESVLGGVLPEFRGRGVARTLARHQIQAVTGMNYRVLRVHTAHDNAAMLGVCLREGFDVSGMFRNDRRKMTLIALTRQLQSSPA
jgi:predicted GNAT superfamily acetyltransferase